MYLSLRGAAVPLLAAAASTSLTQNVLLTSSLALAASPHLFTGASAVKPHAQQIPFQQQYSSMASQVADSAAAAATGGGSVKDSKGQDVDAKTYQLIKDAQDLFSAKPSLEIFKRSWSPDAIFADPICHAEGWKQYAAQWYAMPKAFSESKTLSWSLKTSTPELIEYEQSQHYKIRGLGTVKQMNSLVVMQLNNEGKIKHFEDRWDAKPLPSGSIAMFLRRMNARTVPMIVSYPKDGDNELRKEL